MGVLELEERTERRSVVARKGVLRALGVLGGHPAAALGIDLSGPDGRARWLVAARLFSERDRAPRIERALRRLAAEGAAAPAALAAADPGRVTDWLAEAGLSRAESAAHGLCRLGRALAERHGGDLEGLAAGCEGLEELGGRLAGLAPGFGRAGVLRFLRPLRETWPAAADTPLAETSRAAAVDLGLLCDGDDPEAGGAALRAACARCGIDADPVDVEAALERLGGRACRAGRSARCPLGPDCPARAAALEADPARG